MRRVAISGYRCGFTLVEILLAVAIIGLLAAFIVPASSRAVTYRKNARVASQLRTAMAAFDMNRSETGNIPPSSGNGVIPSGMADYFTFMKITSWWTVDTEIGGSWSWAGGTNAAITLTPTTTDTDAMQELDRMVDDGNLATGSFRLNGSSYSYYQNCRRIPRDLSRG